jgi:hypothetical protein
MSKTTNFEDIKNICSELSNDNINTKTKLEEIFLMLHEINLKIDVLDQSINKTSKKAAPKKAQLEDDVVSIGSSKHVNIKNDTDEVEQPAKKPMNKLTIFNNIFNQDEAKIMALLSSDEIEKIEKNNAVCAESDSKKKKKLRCKMFYELLRDNFPSKLEELKKNFTS